MNLTMINCKECQIAPFYLCRNIHREGQCRLPLPYRKLCEICFGVIAINSGSGTEGLAIGGDGFAVLAKAIGNHAGGLQYSCLENPMDGGAW